ncbi:uncharacterized protein LOC133036302 [Cannabis sativa]|uniref:uncharacterized protein LOC133036302 n=1 Tax=Cannabis sativa TaxID=3483 RepID=UPI0029CA89AE|nr:uncharacterized protein LOC133036302 [Cannabis sativa]
MNWSREVWSRLNILKHSVITCLAMLNRLKTQDRLSRFGVQVTCCCYLCNAQPESRQHLFFDCSIANACLLEVKNWHTQTSRLPQLMRWIERAKTSKFKKVVLATALTALVYNLWKSRNATIWQEVMANPVTIVTEKKWAIKIRIESLMPRKIKSSDREWFLAL